MLESQVIGLICHLAGKGSVRPGLGDDITGRRDPDRKSGSCVTVVLRCYVIEF